MFIKFITVLLIDLDYIIVLMMIYYLSINVHDAQSSPTVRLAGKVQCQGGQMNHTFILTLVKTPPMSGYIYTISQLLEFNTHILYYT